MAGLAAGLRLRELVGLNVGDVMTRSGDVAWRIDLPKKITKGRRGGVAFLSERGGVMLDVQWLTPHLASLGAEVIGREAYLSRLPAALAAPDPFEGLDSDVGWG